MTEGQFDISRLIQKHSSESAANNEPQITLKAAATKNALLHFTRKNSENENSYILGIQR